LLTLLKAITGIKGCAVFDVGGTDPSSDKSDNGESNEENRPEAIAALITLGEGIKRHVE
jgi:hypothetical protein